MKNSITTSLILSLISLTFLNSCKKSDDASHPHDHASQEQITTLILRGFNKANPTNSKYVVFAKWEDLDGEGGNAPLIDSLILDTGISYSMDILLLDKTKTPYDTVSNEIIERGDIHQFFYTPSPTLLDKLIIERLDKDNKNPALPIGIQTQWNVLAKPSYTLPVSGTVNIVLSHYHSTPKTAIRSPESDIDISFPVKLK